MNFFAKIFADRRTLLSTKVEQLLIGHFSIYWKMHPSTPAQHQEVVELIRKRVSMTTDDVLQSILDPELPHGVAAGILDKIVDKVYGGNSDFFLKLLTQK